jgi:hypothetical protein
VTNAPTSTLGAACLGMTALLTAGLAYGGASARLVYARAPEAASCPDELALRNAVAARLGYDPFFPWAKETVVVQVWRESRQYKARLQLVSEAGLAHGTRTLSSSQTSCAELFDAAALAISIAMDSLPKDEPAPTAPPAEQPPPAPAPEPAPPPAPSPPPPAPTPAEAPAPPPVRLGLMVGLDAVGVVGAEPGPTVAGAAFVGVRGPALSLALEGRVDAPASAASAAGPGRVRVWSFQAAIVPCARYRVASFCALGVVSSVRGESADVTNPGRDSAISVAAGARVGLDWPLSETFSLDTHLDATADLRRVHMQLGGADAWTAPPVAAAAAVGVMAHFQ